MIFISFNIAAQYWIIKNHVKLSQLLPRYRSWALEIPELPVPPNTVSALLHLHHSISTNPLTDSKPFKPPFTHRPNQPNPHARSYCRRSQDKCSSTNHTTKRRCANRRNSTSYERIFRIADYPPEYKDPDEADGAQKGSCAEMHRVRSAGGVGGEEIFQVGFRGG
jgi:hypothetical protein